MSLQGLPSDAPDAFAPPGAATPPAQPGDVPLPVRARSSRGGNAAARPERPGEDEPFSGGPLFMPNASDARGVSYAEKFTKHGLTEADRPDLGLRLRLIAPDPEAKGGTTRVGFSTELLHPDSPAEAIHDRWGPGLYEVALCWKTAANRTRSAIIERRLSLPIRTGGEFGPDGEYDVGREPWPVDLDVNSSVPAEVRDEIERREEIREEIRELDRSGGRGYDDPRGGYPPSRDDRDPRGYGNAYPPPPPAAPLAPAMPPAGSFPQGTSFVQINGQWVAQTPAAPTPAKPSVVDGFLEKFTADPVATASSVAAALAALKGIVAPAAPPPPPAPTAQDIAAAVAAALAPVLQAVTARPSGPDPMEVFKAQLVAEREAAERRAAEDRAARAEAEARREREAAEERLKAERERAEAEARRERDTAARDQQFQLQLAALRNESKLTALQHQVEAAKHANEGERQSLLKDLDEARKKLRSGEDEAPLDWTEKLATLADTEAGKVAAPKIVDLVGRVFEFLTSSNAPPTPPAPLPVYAPPMASLPFTPPEAAQPYPNPSPAHEPAPPPDSDDEGDDPEAP